MHEILDFSLGRDYIVLQTSPNSSCDRREISQNSVHTVNKKTRFRQISSTRVLSLQSLNINNLDILKWPNGGETFPIFVTFMVETYSLQFKCAIQVQRYADMCRYPTDNTFRPPCRTRIRWCHCQQSPQFQPLDFLKYLKLPEINYWS